MKFEEVYRHKIPFLDDSVNFFPFPVSSETVPTFEI
jgi:hypothetical protein